jgi:hypothetical protein
MVVDYSDLYYRLQEEGEGYALKHYYGPDIEHSDEKVVKLWKETHDKLVELEKYLIAKMSEEEDYDGMD